MARRRKDDEWIGLVAQVVGVALLLGLISIQVRQILSAIELIAVCVAAIAIIGLFGFGVYKFSSRSKRAIDFPQSLNCQLSSVETKDEQYRPNTTAELIEQLRTIDWFQFEKLVERIYIKLGYAVTRRGGANPDGGIDLIVEKDGERSAVQCKHWRTWNVGVKSVREFLGALTDAGIQKGIFITLAGYTGEAKQLAAKHGIEIVNEADLAQIIEDAESLFDPAILTILKDERKICPKCKSTMVLRTAIKGVGAGSQFWGCSGFPKCRFTMPASQ